MAIAQCLAELLDVVPAQAEPAQAELAQAEPAQAELAPAGDAETGPAKAQAVSAGAAAEQAAATELTDSGLTDSGVAESELTAAQLAESELRMLHSEERPMPNVYVPGRPNPYFPKHKYHGIAIGQNMKPIHECRVHHYVGPAGTVEKGIASYQLTAEHLWLTLRRDEARLELCATDDGRGAEELTARGGIAGMTERLRSCGGDWSERQ